jgi:hypothetical protein
MKAFSYSFLSMLALLPCSTLACMPRDGFEYKVPTEAERTAEADVVFVARVSAMMEAPEMRRTSEHPYIHRVTMNVSRWLKGSGDTALVIFDTGGTDCDFLTGISHIWIPQGASMSSFQWHVFARRSQGQLWVISAHRMR